MKILVFVTDAFGGHGGIAKYVRDLIRCLCSYPTTERVVALPRLAPQPSETLPRRLDWRREALGGRRRYVRATMQCLLRERRFDLVLCGHINLLPVAHVASLRYHAPLALWIYGIDAWQPTANPYANALARRVNAVASISRTTLERMQAWAPVPEHRCHIVPNAIELECFGPGPKPTRLLERHGLAGRTVIMTLGRLCSRERAKGFDVVLDLLPTLKRDIPAIAYLVVGDGTDRERLEAKARKLGLTGDVVFTGMVSEEDKPDYYRVADAYVMPSRGEGFGFVFLEALACGIPVVASSRDGGREAVRGGMLGQLVDPADREDVRRGILEALHQPRGQVPQGLRFFAFESFERRVHAFLDGVRRD